MAEKNPSDDEREKELEKKVESPTSTEVTEFEPGQAASSDRKLSESTLNTSDTAGTGKSGCSVSPSSGMSPEIKSPGKRKKRSWLKKMRDSLSPRRTKEQHVDAETGEVTGANPEEAERAAVSDKSVESAQRTSDTSAIEKTESGTSASPPVSKSPEEAKKSRLAIQTSRSPSRKSEKDIECYGAESSESAEEKTDEAKQAGSFEEILSESTRKTSDTSGIGKTASSGCASTSPSDSKSLKDKSPGGAKSRSFMGKIISPQKFKRLCSGFVDAVSSKLSHSVKSGRGGASASGEGSCLTESEVVRSPSGGEPAPSAVIPPQNTGAIPKRPSTTRGSGSKIKDQTHSKPIETLAEHVAAVNLQDSGVSVPTSRAITSGLGPIRKIGKSVESQTSSSTDEGCWIAEFASSTSSSSVCDTESTNLESQDVFMPDKTWKKRTQSDTDAERSQLPSLAEYDETESVEGVVQVSLTTSASPQTKSRSRSLRATEMNDDMDTVDETKGARGSSTSPRRSEFRRQTRIDSGDDDPATARTSASSASRSLFRKQMKETDSTEDEPARSQMRTGGGDTRRAKASSWSPQGSSKQGEVGGKQANPRKRVSLAKLKGYEPLEGEDTDQSKGSESED